MALTRPWKRWDLVALAYLDYDGQLHNAGARP